MHNSLLYTEAVKVFPIALELLQKDAAPSKINKLLLNNTIMPVIPTATYNVLSLVSEEKH